MWCGCGGSVLGVACWECVFVCCMFDIFCVACCVRGWEYYVVCEWFSVSCIMCDVTACVLCDVQRIVFSVACVCVFGALLPVWRILCVVSAVDFTCCMGYCVLYICWGLCVVCSVSLSLL